MSARARAKGPGTASNGVGRAVHGRGIARRPPATDVTPRRLRERGRLVGPRIFVVINDYDLVATVRAAHRPRRNSAPERS